MFLAVFYYDRIKTMESSLVLPQSGLGQFRGTGGFLDPDSVVGKFGLSEGMRVADLGCGAGYFTILLAQKVGSSGKVYALDVVESALDSVRAKANALGLNNIETIRTNLEILGSSSLLDESQDFSLLANVLFQSNKKADIIREGKRILKSGGELVIIDWKKNAGAMSNGLSAGQAGRQGFGPPDSLRPDISEVHGLAEKENFIFEHQIDVGQFHFGLMFKKP